MSEFNPDWVLCPGEHIQEFLEEDLVEREELVSALGFSDADFHALLSGDMEIDDDIAAVLGKLIGPSSGFWIRLEARFREGLRLGKSWVGR